MAKMEFRRITPCEAERAYNIICETVDWLRSKSIKQWTEPIPRDVFERRQQKGENFGLVVDGSLVAVLSLIQDSLAYWSKETGAKTTRWLCTLATANDFRGRGLGRMAVLKALEHLRDSGADELFLDCAYENGFLPGFYRSLGFQLVTRKVINWPKCGPMEMALMKYDFGRDSGP